MAWKNSNALLRNERVKNKSWFTRVKSWWNNLLNPDHDWLDYDSAPDSLNSRFDNFMRSAGSAVGELTDTLLSPGSMSSLINSWTGAHLTGSQVEANQMQMQNAEDLYQRQVVGMQKAGINPALMYQNGASANAPSVQGSQGSANMSEVMQALLLKRQTALLDAQTANVNADTDKKKAETENMNLVNKYYPDVTDTQINKMLKEMGLTDAQIEKIYSEVNLNNLDAELKKIQKVINQAEADESSAYFKAIRELQQARTDSEKASARASVARAVIDELEGNFIDKYDVKMGSSEYIAIASALANLFGVDLDLFSKSPFDGFADMLRQWRSSRKPAGAAYGGGGR